MTHGSEKKENVLENLLLSVSIHLGAFTAMGHSRSIQSSSDWSVLSCEEKWKCSDWNPTSPKRSSGRTVLFKKDSTHLSLEGTYIWKFTKIPKSYCRPTFSWSPPRFHFGTFFLSAFIGSIFKKVDSTSLLMTYTNFYTFSVTLMVLLALNSFVKNLCVIFGRHLHKQVSLIVKTSFLLIYFL